MGWLPLQGSYKVQCYPALSGSTYALAVSTADGANTAGNWTQIAASLDFDAIIRPYAAVSNIRGYDHLLSVGVGGAGAEVAVISNAIFSVTAAGAINRPIAGHILAPFVFAPKGSRISLKLQSTYAGILSHTFNLITVSVGGFVSPQPFQLCTTYGANTADSGRVGVDPGGTANTKGAWSIITAGLTYGIKGFSFGIGDKANTARTSANFAVDIGIGAAGYEQVIVSDYPMYAHANHDQIMETQSMFFPIPLPAGTVISARALSTTNDATDRLFDIVLYGMS